MTKTSELEAGLEGMADDFVLPGGSHLKVARLIAAHLDWFDMAEALGLTWQGMAQALAAAGVTDKRGKPLSIGTLSSAVWRARGARSNAPTKARRSARPAPLPTTQGKQRVRPKSKVRPKSAVSQASRARPITTKSTSAREDVLGYMKRAAALRKGRDDG